MPLRLVLAALGGLALTASFEPIAIPYLLPFGLAAFALATRDLTFWRSGLVGLVFGVAFYFTHIDWMRTSIGPDAWVALSAIEALFYGLVGLAVPLVRRLPAWPVWLAATWTAADGLRSGWPFSGMPWGRLGFAVVDTPVAAALAYVGMTGLSFLLALVGFLLAAGVETWLDRSEAPVPRARQLGFGGALAILAVLVIPTVAPYETEVTGSAVVAAVQGNLPGPADDILYDHRGVTRNHVDATIDLADGDVRPDFVLWPENSTAVDPFRESDVNDGIREAVAAVGVPVVVGGLIDDGEDHVLNQGIVWDPVTGPGERYTKQHPVAYGEYIPFRRYWDPNFGALREIGRDMKSGTRTSPIQVAGIKVADAICFDVAYDDVARDQLQEGAELMTVQTSNASFIFTDQIDQQFAITRLRAIESGRWLVVAATNGITGVIAPDGTVVASADPRTTAVLVEQVGLSTELTPAIRLGAWPARVLTGLALLGLVLGAIAYRRQREEDAASTRDASDAPAPETSPSPSETSVG
ncbi:apolipoprotein N-acyltransferase [Nocardioides bizhenqiangii]|uniref:Apolipoprotein N-acyltransferase n=1 Tax=Nocardioides bizhenqiangii TaxID=3095076 RepID=A0ABZ0ZJ82_9ACTN|nr:apolipoprotein N-acyltransferase [Nocardioides sp. HM61]WQQ24562.1 apolipoprotein N-acyltransferase [Nocardioides sp. HM61]